MRYFVLFLLLIVSCNNIAQEKTAPEITVKPNESLMKERKVQTVLEKTIEAHGGHLYDVAHYKFIFRDKTYEFKNSNKAFSYKMSFDKNGYKESYVLDNSVLTHSINNEPQLLTDKETVTYSNGLNSVIYFATLPHKLSDEAVNVIYEEAVIIKGNNYDVLMVSFNEENGGEDHDDKFCYWVNKTTHKIDYLAYSYNVGKGGVRFRSAYNRRVIDGITFQDYINYKAPKGTGLKDLPQLFETSQLKELSKIETEHIINLNKL